MSILLPLLSVAALTACSAADADIATLQDFEVLQVTDASLLPTLRSLPPTDHVLMEFYASWCPACRHFAPTYEAVGQVFNASPRPLPTVWVARIDCATEKASCSAFSIGSFPTMKFGLPKVFEEEHRKQLEAVPRLRTTQKIVSWVGDRVGATYSIPDAVEGDATGQAVVAGAALEARPAPVQTLVDTGDVVSATLLAYHDIITSPNLPGFRTGYLDFLALVSVAHPAPECREGAGSILSQVDELWEPDADAPGPGLSEVALCGAAQVAPWGACKGSEPDTRGFTCGLWQLFHSTAANVPEELGAVFMEGLTAYIDAFFSCSTCQEHFAPQLREPAALAVHTRREAMLWIWERHNAVSTRLKREEAEGLAHGDPAYPKNVWPSASLCPLCRLSSSGGADDSRTVEWNIEEVVRFLDSFYGVAQHQEEAQSLGPKGGIPHARGHAARPPRSRGLRLWLLAALLVCAGAVFALRRLSPKKRLALA